jgi:serine/threonine-protein kinase
MESLSRTKADPNQDKGQPTNDSPTDLRRLGDYRVLRRLGEGGMGAVYLGYHEATDKHFALKVLSDALASNQTYVDRFYREFKSGALLNHPSIVRSVAAGQDPATSKHYLVLEYVEGTSAQALLEQFGHLSVGDAVHIALDIARALEHAHSRNVVHRDIKPDNILITKSGVSKLTDLGLAKRTDETSHLTAARQGFGTPFYMPYEQAINAKHADGRSDIYALGATLYHLLTGEVPFKGESPLEIVEAKERGDFIAAGQLNSAVPRLLDQILSRMLARLPRDRYQTASELIVDLERSRLAAAVPSYADTELALKDPWVRACLASSGQPTQPDLSQAGIQTPTPDADKAEAPRTWTVRYLGRDSRWRRVRLTADQVLKRLSEGKLPPESEACGTPREGFRPLKDIPAFASAFSSPRPARPPRKKGGSAETPEPRWNVAFIAGMSALLLGVLVLVYLIFLRP